MNKDNTLKWNAKDSIFCDAMRDKKNAARVYNDIHPGEDITEEDLEIITLSHAFEKGPVNDCCFMVGGKTIVLIEAQSTMAPNVIARCALYTCITIAEYFTPERVELLHKTSWTPFPWIEVYIVYVGKERLHPSLDTISLADEFYKGDNSFFDLKAKILQKGNAKGFLGEYVGLCSVLYRNQGKFGNSQACIKATFEECRKYGYMVEYLAKHSREAEDAMKELLSADRRTLLAIEGEAERKAKELAPILAREMAEEMAEEMAKEMAKEMQFQNLLESMKRIMEKGIAFEEALSILGIPEDTVPAIMEALKN